MAFESLGRLFEGLRSTEVAALSPDERILLVGNRLFDLQRRCELPYVRTGGIFGAAFSRDSQWLALANGRTTPPVTLVNLKEDSQQIIEDASFAAFSPQDSLLALVVEEGTAIRLMDPAAGTPKIVIRGDLKTETLVFTPDGSRLLSTHYSQQPRLWDVASGQELPLPESRDRLSGIPVFSPDGRLLANASGTKIYDAKTWKTVAEVELPSSATDRRFAPDGSQLWVQCRRHLCVVDVVAGSVAAKTHGGPDNIYRAAFSRDGRQAWAVVHDRVEWYGRGGNFQFEPREVAATPAARLVKGIGYQLVFSPDGKTLVEQPEGRDTVLRDASTGTPLGEIPRPKSGGVVGAVVSLARPTLYRFGGYNPGLVELMALPDGKPIGEIRLPEGQIKRAAISDDGRYLALVIEKDSLVLLNAASGERLGTVSLGAEVRSLAISPNGEELAVVVGGWQAGGNAELKQLSLPDLRERARHELHQRGGAHLAYSPDGQSLAVLEDYDILVRDAATGRRTAIIRDTDRDSFVYTGDGRYIIAETGSGFYEKKRLAAYDASSGLVVRYFTDGPQAEFQGTRCMALSPDGQILVAAQNSGLVWWQMPEELVSVRQAPGSPSSEVGGSGIVAAARVLQPLRKREVGGVNGAVHLGRDEQTVYTVERRPRPPHVIRRWNALTGRSIDQAVEWGPGGLPMIGSDDGRIWLAYHQGCDFWDVASGRMVASQSSGRAETKLASLAPDGSFALFVGQDRSVGDRLVRHEAADGEVRSQLIATNLGQIESLTTSPDGKLAAIGANARAGAPKTVQLIDLADPDRRQAMDLQDYFVPYTLQFSSDGRRLFGSYDDNVLAWSTESGELLLALRHDGIGRALAVAPDGEKFAAVARDRDGAFVGVWESLSGNLLARLTGIEFGASKLQFTADARHVHAWESGTLFTWALASEPSGSGPATPPGEAPATAKLLYSFDAGYEIPALRFADKGQTIAGDAIRISLATGQRMTPRWVVDKYRSDLHWLTGDGSRQLQAENDALDSKSLPRVRSTPRILTWTSYEAEPKKVALTVSNIPNLRPGTVAFGNYRQILANEQFNRVVTLQADNSAYLWALGAVRNVPQLNERQAVDCHVKELPDDVLCAEFDRSGEHLVLGTPQGAELWNAVDGEQVDQLAGPTGAIHLIRISPDRTTMVTFGSQGLQLWKLPEAAGELKLSLIAQLTSPEQPVAEVCFDADGRRIGVTFQNGAPRVYSTAGGRLAVECEAVDVGARGVAFSPDGTMLAASCADRTIRVWRLP